MRKFAILAFSCLLIASIFAGCRRNNGAETSNPSGGSTTGNTTTATTSTTAPTTQTTRPTQNTTRPSEGTTTPLMPEGPGGTTGTDNEGRVRQTPPRY